METLFEQQDRRDTLDMHVRTVLDTADILGWDRTKLTVDQANAIAAIATAALAVQSANVFDEQLAGFGDIASEALTDIVRTMKQLVEALKEREIA